MLKLFYLTTIGYLLFLMTGCNNLPKATPVAYGKVNQVQVVMDDDLWEGPLGDTVRTYFGSAYPMMPAPEPYFELRHFSASALMADPLRKELRTYLIIGNIDKQNSSTADLIRRDLGDEKLRKAKREEDYNSAVAKNKWAKPQLLIYLFADSDQKLSEVVRKHFQAAARRIHEHDRRILKADLYQGGENKELVEEIRQKFLVHIKIPKDYVLALEKDNAVWIRKMDDKILSNIIISRFEYRNQNQLSTDSLKSVRNSLGRLLVSSSEPGSYMTTNDVDLPIYTTQRKINGAFAQEMRGIWEMVNDFAGGPFFTYGILSPDQKSILFVDVFVLAPGEDKKLPMQYLEEIVQSVKFVQ